MLLDIVSILQAERTGTMGSSLPPPPPNGFWFPPKLLKVGGTLLDEVLYGLQKGESGKADPCFCLRAELSVACAPSAQALLGSNPMLP